MLLEYLDISKFHVQDIFIYFIFSHGTLPMIKAPYNKLLVLNVKYFWFTLFGLFKITGMYINIIYGNVTKWKFYKTYMNFLPLNKTITISIVNRYI